MHFSLHTGPGVQDTTAALLDLLLKYLEGSKTHAKLFLNQL